MDRTVGRATPVRRYAYADETVRDASKDSSAYYQLAAVMLEGDDLTDMKKAITGFADLSGEFKASNLANAGDRARIADLLQCVLESPCFNLVIVNHEHQQPQELARQSCVEALLLELDHQKVHHLTLDSRQAVVGLDPEARNKVDLATRRRLIRAQRIDRNFIVRHQHDTDERMLWVPDAVGWAHRRHLLMDDSDLWTQVQDVVKVIRL